MNDSTRKLLVVEDDIGLQRQLKWRFESFQVVCAGDRAEALAALKSFEPAVVLQDLGLPPDADPAFASAAVTTRSPSFKVALVISVEVPSLSPVVTTTRCGMLLASRIQTAFSGAAPFAARRSGHSWRKL